ncbi:MAG: ribosome-binding factor A, partial [Bacteroidales bacterium]
TSVRITSDLSLARVNLSIFATKDKEEALVNIKKKSAEIRLLLGKRVRNQLRIVPSLTFYLDNSLDQIERIEDLLKS